MSEDKFTFTLPLHKEQHGQFVIRCLKNGKRYPAGDYFADDKDDCQATYVAMVSKDKTDCLKLIKEVHDVFYNNTSTFDNFEYSADIIYLMGAIASGGQYDVTPESHDLDFEERVFELFPEGHPVRKYLVRESSA